ncbi:MAG: hypothetical protein GAK30_00481 [Paracidovorax wautersii]|uniref:SecDF P1 head subdomain domain-containing protein n=1 Tax=Paracidovorax wautersii TaxID=1177982 RepID=A0A7V8FS41_9BURK|nr:MAG: hypothetical protein GAK30_00481 [Paracidovorax wautersii]
MRRQNWKAGLALMAAVLAFWAGMQFQKAHDYDRCLDLGGGPQPGQHPLCVIPPSIETGLWIGPLQIRADDVVAVERSDATPAAPQLSITLDETAAFLLEEYTRRHLGHDLAVRVNGRVIRQVRIAQALGGSFVLPDLAVQDADVLQQMLASGPEEQAVQARGHGR